MDVIALPVEHNNPFTVYYLVFIFAVTSTGIQGVYVLVSNFNITEPEEIVCGIGNGRSPHIFNCGFRRIKIQLGNASDIGARYERAEIDDATLHIRTDKFCSVGFYLDDITGK